MPSYRSGAHKYHAIRTEVDGITFASKAEAHRYAELKLLEKAGEIYGLVLQPKFPLYALGYDARNRVVGYYIADFSYQTAKGHEVIEDVKGVKTPLYRWKKKHFELQQSNTITEITR